MTESTARAGKERERERHDESGLEPDSLCVSVCVWIGRVSWAGLLFGSRCHAMFDKHSCPHWPAAVRRLLLCWLNVLPVCMCSHMYACTVSVHVCDFQWLCIYSTVLVCARGNPEADWVFLSHTDRTPPPSKQQLPAALMALSSRALWAKVTESMVLWTRDLMCIKTLRKLHVRD